MKLIDLYLMDPMKNYHLIGEAGSGKTSSLIYLCQRLLDDNQRIEGKKILPIYVKMNQFNLQKIEYEPIQSLIARKYFEGQSSESINKMFEEESEYIFLIILDGVNEVVNGLADNRQKIYSIFENELRKLLSTTNVRLIISSRNTDDVFEGKQTGYFTELYMKKLDNKQIMAFVGEVFDYTTLEEILTNPMLLQMFNSVYKRNSERAKSLRNKYQLMEYFFFIDTDLKKTDSVSDSVIEANEYIYEKILPYVAFEMESCLLKNRKIERSFEDVIDEALRRDNYVFSKDYVLDKIKTLGYKDFYSMHDLVREFMAVCEWNKRIEYGDIRCAEFLKDLIDQIKFIEKKDLERRTKHLDLGELFLGCYGKSIAEKVRMVCEDKEAKELAQLLFQEIAGVYEDLGKNYEDRSARYGWDAVDLMNALEIENPYELSRKKNFLFYCVLNGDPMKYEDPLMLINEAAELINNCESNRKNRKEICRLKGKILSNIGAYYYEDKWGKDVKRALEYHRQALEYRIKNSIYTEEDIDESYRTIMSDYYKLGEFDNSYNEFKKIVIRQVKKIDENYWFLSDLDQSEWKYVIGIADKIIRGMGSEIRLLAVPNLRDEILREIRVQIPIVFEAFSNGGRRSDKGSLKDLYENKLLKLKDEKLDEETKEIVEHYILKCRERLGKFG